MEMMGLLRKIYPLRMAPVSDGVDEANRILLGELPFEVLEYPSLMEHNGWAVPLKWEARKASISKGGKPVFDGMKHPLGVMGYSKSFKGTVGLEELKRHLSYRKDMPDCIGYHCDWYYKQHLRDWGFCVPYSLFTRLGPGDYDVELEASSEPGTMKVLDLHIPGELEDTIILNAHNCHAAQANDDVAGMVVGVEVARRLMKRKNRYSYRLIIAPEHIGTVFYLAGLGDREARKLKLGMFLEMLGNENRFALQKSFPGNTLMDRAAMHYLRHRHPDFHSDEFRNIVGNDESVWEAPGYEVHTVSLSRAPYREYHTELDNPGLVSPKMLDEAADAVMGIISILETNTAMRRKFKGLVALSNPKYDLYHHTVDPSIDRVVTGMQLRWNRMMDRLPMYFDQGKTALDIAEIHGLPYDELYAYLCRFRDKGLVDFVPPKTA